MNKAKLFGLLGFLLIIGLGTVWGWSYFHTDPQLAKVHQIRKALTTEVARDMPREERREKWLAFRKEVEALTPEQQQSLRREQMGQFAQRMEQHLDEFLALSPEQRTESLDEQIDQMEQRRQEWEQRRAERGDGEGRRGGWDRGGRNNDPGVRNQWRRRRLDATSPELRAKMTEYRRLMNDRRRQRGLPEAGRGWGGPGRYWGRGGGDRQRNSTHQGSTA